MMGYRVPLEEQLLALNVSAGIEELASAKCFADATSDTVASIVEGIGVFAANEFAPLNRVGDTEGAKLINGDVRLPTGYAGSYASLVEQGWNSIAGPKEFAGQGLPSCLTVCVLENLGAANVGFALLPMLTVGAVEAIEKHGSQKQKDTYLTKLVSGEWSGTMNLTEPQAGSDVGALRTVAVPISDGPHTGSYRIKGSKIFISWGDHDLAENIIHLVLARTSGAPTGSKGISLFIAPKYLVGENGLIGARNDIRAVALEHKLGLHTSPTCVMSFGEEGDCIGELVGTENGGLKAMFTMMNSARLNVGSQGVQVAEAALQRAAIFAQERIQSPRGGATDRTPVPIIEHPDVRRMLLRMRSLTEGARALVYHTAGQVDRATLNDPAARIRADLLVPLAKAWATDIGCEVASLGVQVHGGMGFVEETGAAQHYRDARIFPIYEGTNGIQAIDFVMRKVAGDSGAALQALMNEIIENSNGEPMLTDLAGECIRVGEWLVGSASPDDRLAGATPFLAMCSIAVAGWQLLRQARVAVQGGGVIARTKPVTARFFINVIVAEAIAHSAASKIGSAILYSLSTEELVS
jgi:alkylation response protein AidB-like acyl-CoA dehydrogenase